MAKNVQLTIDIKGNDSVGKAAEATKNLKTQLKDLKKELLSGTLEGKAFDEATKRAAKLQEAIDDVNQGVKSLANSNVEIALNGFMSLANGIVGGFSAAQGAMALFGDENEEVQKQLVKIQGAMALLNGVQAINNSLKKEEGLLTAANTAKTKILTFVQSRYAMVVGTTTGAMKAMRLVGATLGIGAISLLIGLLITNFDKVKNVVMSVVDRFKNLGAGTKNLISVLFPIVGVIRLVYAGLEKMGLFAESAADKLEKIDAASKKLNKQREREIEILEAQGGQEDKIFKKRLQNLTDEQLMLMKKKLFSKATGDALQEEIDAIDDLTTKINVLKITEENRLKDVAEKDAKAKEEAAKKSKEAADKQQKLEEEIDNRRKKSSEELINEQLRRFDEQNKKIKDDKQAKLDIEEEYQDALFQKELDANKKYGELIEQRRIDDLSIRDKELFDIEEKYRIEQELALGNAKLLEQIEADKNKALSDKKLEFAKQDADAQKEIDLVRLDSIIATANQASQLLGQVAGKNKAVQTAALAIEKGAAIADVVIKGIRERAGITAKYSLIPGGVALSQPELIASRVRTGLSIATIAATGIQGAKSISAGVSGGGGSVQPPNIRGSQTTNEQPTPQPTKVFVTETDIRSVTRKVDGIYTQATIQ